MATVTGAASDDFALASLLRALRQGTDSLQSTACRIVNHRNRVKRHCSCSALLPTSQTVPLHAKAMLAPTEGQAVGKRGAYYIACRGKQPYTLDRQEASPNRHLLAAR